MKTNKIVTTLLLILILLYGLGCTYLYYNQLFWADTGMFESDLPFHISMAVEDHWFYSLTAICYGLFYMTPWGNGLTALLLGAVTVATIFATASLVEELTGSKFNINIVLTVSIMCNVVMPFYLSVAGSKRYIGYQSPSIWHNSTYICMKLAAILTFTAYLKLKDKYAEGLSVKQWLSFALLLIICNAIKPSFALTFLPVMALLLLVDLIKKTNFWKIVIFGLSVIPSLLVVLFQNMVLFGEDTGNGIIIKPFYALAMRGDHPKITLILSIAFPLAVFAFACLEKIVNKNKVFDKNYVLTLLIWLSGFLQVFLLTESGSRSLDSNFFWGYSIALFFIYLTSLIKTIEEKNIICYLIFAYQTYCGIYFFLCLLEGTTYWM